MSSLLVFCRDCGKQVPSSQANGGFCLDCQVRRSVAELRDEHARLWRKRGYCDCNSYAGMDRLMPAYVDALEQELAFARERYTFQQLETVYLGGGTPSLLPPTEASRLLEFIRRSFNVAPDAEVTLEANPASTDETKLTAWLDGGV